MSVTLPVIAAQALTAPSPTSQAAGASTAAAFGRVLENANVLLKQADATASGFVQGKVDLTDAVLAADHADLSFGFLIALRNRALSAYQEIMNMAV